MSKIINEQDERPIRRSEPLSGVKFHIIKNTGNRREIWLPDLEIIFVLKGNCKVSFKDGMVYSVKAEDIFAINCFEICSIDIGNDAVLLSTTVSSDVIAALHAELLRYKIDCRSFLYSEDNQENFDIIRKDIACAFKETYKSDDLSYPKSKITALLEDLTRYFAGEERSESAGSGRERIQMAADYILENYKEEITLESLSRHIYLSETYISRSFPKYFGVSFLEYVTQVRLNHAVEDMSSDLSLTEIAYNNGFTSENMMIRAFRKYRGVTPGEYRKNLVQDKKSRRFEEDVKLYGDSFGFYDDDCLKSVLKYADSNESSGEAGTTKNLIVDVNVNSRKSKTENHFRRIINGGYARSVLDAEVQRELKLMVKHVGYEFIRVKGILDDDMLVYREVLTGQIMINFVYVDKVIDFILSLGAKPMLEIGHMPGLLIKGKGLRFLRPASNCPPNNLSEWKRLVEALMNHLLERYGVNKMRSWIFTPWITSDYIGSMGAETYMEAYKISHDAIKSTCGEFVTCHSFSSEGGESNNIEAVLHLMKKYDCMPDILATRTYNTSFGEDEKDVPRLIENIESFNFCVAKDPNYTGNILRKIKSALKKHGMENMPVLIDECNSNIWQRDLCSDTCYKAAWFMKTMLENEENCNGIAYFNINDTLDEVFPAQDEFHGGFGMFTPQGIPKAVAVAAKMLGKVGNYIIKKGEGYFVSYNSEKSSYQILLYNYVHYDTLYRYRHTVNLSRCDRYRVFENNSENNVTVRLTGLPCGFLKKRTYKITREHGSSYDAWVRMGAPKTIDDEEKKFLVHAADPEYRSEKIEITGEEPLMINECLKPHEVVLVEILLGDN